MTNATFSVLGAGTWGMALARMLALNGNGVTVWSAIGSEIDGLAATHAHPKLPGMVVPDSIHFTKDLQEACTGCDFLLFAVPSVFVRRTAKSAAPFVADGQIVIDVAKGIEAGTQMTMSEIILDEMRRAHGHERVRVVALSGPTHAEEVAVDLPTTIVAACTDMDAARQVQDAMMNENFRVYTNDDVRGVEIGGALKNVIALATGIARGMGYGDNAKAALITRGIAEITRLGAAMGCRPETFSGLAGLGDLVVTCTSLHSRNLTCGMMLGQGVPRDEAIQRVGMVVEGIYAIEAAMELMEKYQVDMPIIRAANAIINEGADLKQTVQALMLRDKKSEKLGL